MKVFATGATGVLGSRLVDQLAASGHTVVGPVRDESGAQLVDARGGDPRRGDVLQLSSLESAIDADVDAIVHAAYVPVTCVWAST